MLDATNGPGFVLSGNLDKGWTDGQGTFASYWSSTAGGAGISDAYYLVITSSTVSPANWYTKRVGYTVRCVAQ